MGGGEDESDVGHGYQPWDLPWYCKCTHSWGLRRGHSLQYDKKYNMTKIQYDKKIQYDRK